MELEIAVLILLNKELSKIFWTWKEQLFSASGFLRLLLSIHKNSDSIIQEIMKSFEFIKTKAGKGKKDLKWGTWGYELVFKYKDLLIQSNFVLHGIEEFIYYMEENYVRLQNGMFLEKNPIFLFVRKIWILKYGFCSFS